MSATASYVVTGAARGVGRAIAVVPVDGGRAVLGQDPEAHVPDL